MHANILKAWKPPSAEVATELLIFVIQETGLQDEGSLGILEHTRINDAMFSISLI